MQDEINQKPMHVFTLAICIRQGYPTVKHLSEKNVQ